MPHPSVPLSELAVAVQSAVEQALAKHGAVPVDKLWVGFVAPDTIATEETAREIVHQLKPAANLHAQPSVAQINTGAAKGAAAPNINIGRIIIGLIFDNK